MFSLAAISLFLPWLPLLPKQILALNFISDVPALTIAADRVDDEQLRRPKRWDIGLIRRFMIVFGVQSSPFDYVTFGALLFLFHADEAVFQTGWFVESVLTEVLVLLIIRTTRPALKSRPSRWLLWTSIGTVILTIALPYLPEGQWIGLQPLPLTLLGFMIAIAALYGILDRCSGSAARLLEPNELIRRRLRRGTPVAHRVFDAPRSVGEGRC